MIKKLAIAVALAIGAHLGMSAAYSIVIFKSDGTEEGFLLQKKPVVTFNETDLQISFEDNVCSVPCEQIAKIEFIDGYVGVERLKTMDTMMEVVDATTFRLNTPQSANISVYDMEGRGVSSASILRDGDSTIVSLKRCADGVYVITYNNNSFKIIKK